MDGDQLVRHLIIVLLVCAAGVACGQTPVPTKDRIANIAIVTKGRVMKGVPAKISQRKWSWRVCHAGGNLKIVPFFSDGETWTPHEMVECPTLAGAKAELSILNLKVTAKQQQAIDALQAVPTVADVEPTG